MSTSFPIAPYHYRWKCPESSVKLQSNANACDYCVCYVCNISFNVCRKVSHKYAAPTNILNWDEHRGTTDQIITISPTPVDTTGFIKVYEKSLRMGNVFCMSKSYTEEICGVAIGVFKHQLSVETCATAVNMYMGYISSGFAEFETDLKKLLSHSNHSNPHIKTPLGKNAMPKNLCFYGKNSHLGCTYQFTNDKCNIRVYIHPNNMRWVTRDINLCRLILPKRQRPLFGTEDLVMQERPNDSRLLMPHQIQTVNKLAHRERHGITDRLWGKLDLGTENNFYMTKLGLIMNVTANDSMPDSMCRGGLLCNDRGTGKTICMSEHIALNKAPEDWATTSAEPTETAGPAESAGPAEAAEVAEPAEPRSKRRRTMAAPAELPANDTDSDEESDDDDDEDAGEEDSENSETAHSRWEFDPAIPKISTTLVIVPGENILQQWKSELEMANLKVGVIFKTKKIPWKELGTYDVVLTCDTTVRASVYPSTRATAKKNLELPRRRDTDSPFLKVFFWRVVVDECHKMYSGNSASLTLAGNAILQIRTHIRWGITATPIDKIKHVRAYMTLAFGFPYKELARKSAIFHYMKYSRQYNKNHGGTHSETFLSSNFLSAIRVVCDTSDNVLPPIKTHFHKIDAPRSWLNEYGVVHAACREVSRSISSGLTVQQLTYRLIGACSGNTGMRKPLVEDYESKRKKQDTSALEEVPPDITDCSICLDSLNGPQKTNCNHYFCKSCIARCIRVNGNACPLCRTRISNLIDCKDIVSLEVQADIERLEAASNNIEFLEASNVKLDRIKQDVVLWVTEDNSMHRNKNERMPNRIVLFSQFKNVRDGVMSSLTECGISVTNNVKTFQDTDTSVLVVSPRTCAVGLNLAQANIVVIADPMTRGIDEEQAAGRTARIGQKRMVHVHRYCVADTMDEQMFSRTKRKDEQRGVPLRALFSN